MSVGAFARPPTDTAGTALPGVPRTVVWLGAIAVLWLAGEALLGVSIVHDR